MRAQRASANNNERSRSEALPSPAMGVRGHRRSAARCSRASTGRAPGINCQTTGREIDRGAAAMIRKASIPALRRQIDRIDDQLLRLLNRRAGLAVAIAEQKARSNSSVYAPAREKGVLARLARANRGPLPEPIVRAIFREIISASRSLEQRLRIAFLGPEATFAHLAARQQFGAAADYRPAASIAEVFREVEGGRADLGVVPVENSTEGMVAHTLDLLADSSLRICAEMSLPVRHHLL